MFVKTVAAHVDPILASMLFETEFVDFDSEKKIIHVVTFKKFMIFQDLFIAQKNNYQEYLNKIFGYQVMLIVDFAKIAERKQREINKQEQNDSDLQQQTDLVPTKQIVRMQYSKNEKKIDISDKKKWKITHSLLEHFGGIVREIVKDLSDEYDA